MRKQGKSRKSENLGKGKVTPVQIAYIVDRYLSDNNYAQSRSTFRSEASSLISKSQEAPKSLLSLGAILDEYICLKEQKVMMDQERHRLESEKLRVQNLLRGMQDAMNAYNSSGIKTNNAIAQPMFASSMANLTALPPQNEPTTVSPAGYPMNTPNGMSTSRASNTPRDHTTKRRKDVLDLPQNAKRSCVQNSTNRPTLKGTDSIPRPSYGANQANTPHSSANHSSPTKDSTKRSPVQGSNVAKCLFNQPIQTPPPTNSSSPETPRRQTSSQIGKFPLENSSASTSGKEVDCTVLSSETIRVSPSKQAAYYTIERNRLISISSPVKGSMKRLSKREHVKGRLDFESSETATNSDQQPLSNENFVSESNKEIETFDLDLPNFEDLSSFSISELLFDFGLDTGDFNCQPELYSSPDTFSGSPMASEYDNSGSYQVMSELSSLVTEGPDLMTTVQSTSKCIKIVSPVKKS